MKKVKERHGGIEGFNPSSRGIWGEVREIFSVYVRGF